MKRENKAIQNESDKKMLLSTKDFLFFLVFYIPSPVVVGVFIISYNIEIKLLLNPLSILRTDQGTDVFYGCLLRDFTQIFF